MATAEAAIERLCDPAAEVSAHYLIGRDGTITQMVPEDLRAWHAGQGSWRWQEDINSRSIGIELDNRGDHPFSEPQMAALEALLPRIMARWGIPAGGVIGHSDMAPGRKGDPGTYFDWTRLALQGLAGRPWGIPPEAVDEDSFVEVARGAGFTADVPVDALLRATRLRFAPWRRGPLCPDDYVLDTQ